MDFLSDENLKKYKFRSTTNEITNKRNDEQSQQQLSNMGRTSKSRIGLDQSQSQYQQQQDYNTIQQSQQYQQNHYSTKEEMLQLEQLDSLAQFMRNNKLNNSENYPFYNNYNEKNIGYHKDIIYKTILNGNKYNSTNIGISENINKNEKITPESFQEELNRKMKSISQNRYEDLSLYIPNSLDVIGSTKYQQIKPKIYNNDFDNNYNNNNNNNYNDDLYDFTQDNNDNYIQENNNDDFIQNLIEPFNENDCELARINNKIFDDNCWYKKDFRINQIDDPQLYNERKDYFINKRLVRKKNNNNFIYFIHSEIIYNNINEFLLHKDNKEIQNNIKNNHGDPLINADISNGHILNRLYKIDVEREIFKENKLELNLSEFGQIHLNESEELLICGGRANGIVQQTCMIIDIHLNKYSLKTQLNYPRTNPLLLQLDEFVYIIGGNGIQGESITTCERYNIYSQQINAIASLELNKQQISGCVSMQQKCLYIAGIPLIVDSYIQLQKFEPYTNFWSVIYINIDYLPLKQPKQIKMGLYDESNVKSQLYIFCQDLNKYQNYTLSIHDLIGDDIRKNNLKNTKKTKNTINNISTLNDLSQVNSLILQNTTTQNKINTTSTKNLNRTPAPNNINKMLQLQQTPQKYQQITQNNYNNSQTKQLTQNTQNQEILIQDQMMNTLDLSEIIPQQKQQQQQGRTQIKSQYQRKHQEEQQQRVETPRLEQIQYIPQFNEQYKLIFKNRKKYLENLKRKQEYEKNAMLQSLIGDTEEEIGDDTQQLIQNANLNVPNYNFSNINQFITNNNNNQNINQQKQLQLSSSQLQIPRIRSNSKQILTPSSNRQRELLQQQNSIYEQTPTGNNLAKSLFSLEQIQNIQTPKKVSYSPRISKRKPLLTKKQQQQEELIKQQQQMKLFVQQQEELKKKGQIVRIEESRSDFNHLDILASRDFDLYTINKDNPNYIEKFDFISWEKQTIVLKFSPIL